MINFSYDKYLIIIRRNTMHYMSDKQNNVSEEVGHYSSALQAGDFVFISGQIPIDPATGQIAGHSMKEQCGQALQNLKAVLESVGATITNIVKTSVYISDLNEFKNFDKSYGEFMGGHRPARVCVQVDRLYQDVLIEIEAVAYIGEKG